MFFSFADRSGQRRRVDGGVPDVRGAPGQEPEPAQVREAGAAEQGQPEDHEAAGLLNCCPTTTRTSQQHLYLMRPKSLRIDCILTTYPLDIYIGENSPY